MRKDRKMIGAAMSVLLAFTAAAAAVPASQTTMAEETTEEATVEEVTTEEGTTEEATMEKETTEEATTEKETTEEGTTEEGTTEAAAEEDTTEEAALENDDDDSTWKPAKVLDADTRNLYYTNDGSLYQKSIDSKEETELIPFDPEGISVSGEILSVGDLLYYVLNTKDNSIIVCYNSVMHNSETLLAVKNGPGSVDASQNEDVHLMGISGNKLIYREGSWCDYTAQVYDLADHTTVTMMENVGDLIGVSENHYVFMSYASDISPQALIVYEEDGTAVFGCHSYRTAYLDAEAGNLYFRDDNAYYNVHAEDVYDPNDTQEEQMAKAEDQLERINEITSGPATLLKYSISENTAELYDQQTEGNYSYMNLWALDNGLERSIKNWTPLGKPDATPVALDEDESPFTVAGNSYVLRDTALYRMDFATGETVEAGEMPEAFSSMENPYQYWCEIPGSTDIGCCIKSSAREGTSVYVDTIPLLGVSY